ncbi:MAG: M23 family metallopeptidase [Pseudomonadota bacterium]
MRLRKSLILVGLFGLLGCTGSEAAAPEGAISAASAQVESPESAGPSIAAQAVLEAPAEPAVQDAPELTQNTRFSYQGELTQGGFIRGLAPDGTLSATLGDQPLDIAPDGSFFAAFDRDSEGSLTLTAKLETGRQVQQTLTIAPRKWPTEYVNVAKRKLRDPEAYWKKREPEYNAIQAARAKVTGATGWKQDFIWPVKGRISGRFGRQRIYKGEPGSYHSGVDIARPSGVPFVASADGVVVLAVTGFSLEGGLIIIDHGAGLSSAYLHASKLLVKEGDVVRQGQPIGTVGSTGRSTGPHLHWGLKWNDARFDPVLFAGPIQ